jgi:hypothetical protein|tara:strand:+ start:837 stop:974 length:138 start_codon:yes stop_codon:yes gene_type:complete
MKEIFEDGDYKVTIDYDNMTTTFELIDVPVDKVSTTGGNDATSPL